MPLDAVKGEFIPELGPHYHVVPTRKWTESPFFEAAQQEAHKVFANTAKKLKTLVPTSLPPDSVVTQEYRTQGRLVFWFQANLSGKDHYHAVQIKFPPKTEVDLITTGLWKRETVQ